MLQTATRRDHRLLFLCMLPHTHPTGKTKTHRPAKDSLYMSKIYPNRSTIWRRPQAQAGQRCPQDVKAPPSQTGMRACLWVVRHIPQDHTIEP